jgi:crotonobetainyl-CoA:carnitine CoA-transferase CaiB-like acyl-CoA transferase
VFVQNFKVGVIDRLGFGYEALREVNKSLVYCSISGYGQEGPNATAAAYDPAVQSASGLMQLIGTPASGPLRTGFPLVDMSTGLTAAIAIMGALYRRRETGEGQYLDVSMMDSAMSLAAYPYMQYQQIGEEPERLGNASQLRIPTADVFETGNGHLQITALTERQIAGLMTTIGRSESLKDARFSTADARTKHNEEMRSLLVEAFATKSAREWEAELAAAGVPASAVLRLPEALAHEQQQYRNFQQLTQPQGIAEPIRVFNAAYGASVDGPEIQRPPPAVGEHTDELLAEFGFGQAEVATLRADNAV